MATNFKNFLDVITYFQNPQFATDYLISMRWDGHVTCVFCGHDKVYLLKGKTKRFKCCKCRNQFSATKGSIFENSAVPLCKWFAAVYLMANHKKGISSLQLSRDLSVTQRTAWFMLQRIRFAFANKTFEKLSGVVECDETYAGGHVKNQHYEKRINKHIVKQGLSEKTAVFAMLQRGGEVVAFNVGTNPNTELLQPIINGATNTDTTIVTDGFGAYRGLNKSRKHEVVNHSQDEFVRGDFHTNSVEGFFSQLKRSIYGIYHSVSPKHLHRYVDETAYRYNTRQTTDLNRFDLSLSRTHNKRLTYKQLTGKK